MNWKNSWKAKQILESLKVYISYWWSYNMSIFLTDQKKQQQKDNKESFWWGKKAAREKKSVQTGGLYHMECSLLVWAQSTCAGIHFTPETFLMSFQTPPHPSHSLISLGATGRKHMRHFTFQTQPSNLQVRTLPLSPYFLTSFPHFSHTLCKLLFSLYSWAIRSDA